MSKLVMVCLRSTRASDQEAVRRRLHAFLDSLRPDHLRDAPVVVSDDGNGAWAGVFNPSSAAVLHGCSSHVGWFARGADAWWRPGGPAPVGSYGIIRADEHAIELLADYAASRTLWFGHNDEMFVASTSQRAIPWFLGRFEPNPAALAAMLARGYLSAGTSWDRGTRSLGPSARVRLDRATWRLRIEQPPVRFQADPAPDSVHRDRLRAALDAVCGDLGLDWSQWIMPLSGGVDSRAILLRMQRRDGVRCVTWGRRAVRHARGTDALVAAQVAATLGLSHRYLETDAQAVPPALVLERFLRAGEGRIDHVSGYLDGFELWRGLAASGVHGIVRGDEATGAEPVADLAEARLRLGFVRWAEIRGVPSLAELGLEHVGEAEPAPELAHAPGESPSDWVDRVVHAERVPAILGALSELKSGYVEIASPLIAQPIVELIRAQPAHLRAGKRLFRAVSAERGVGVAYATERAIADAESATHGAGLREVLLDELSSRAARELLSPQLVDFVARGTATEPVPPAPPSLAARLRRAAKPFVPVMLRDRLRTRTGTPALSPRRLALRAYLAARMVSRMQQDARGGA